MTDTIEERLDADFAPAWRPEPGDKLIGEVVALTERHGDFGRYPVLTVRRDDGEELALHVFHQVAASKLAEERPQVGDRIGIKYKGKREGKYHDYAVVVDREAQPLDWSQYVDSAEAPTSDVPADTTALHAPLEEQGADDDDIPF